MKQMEQAVQAALSVYMRSHRPTPREVAEARLDFEAFFLAALAAGLRGIRWNFNGCILCEVHQTARLRRILLMDPEVTFAAGNRGFGTVVCETHGDNPQADFREAAILRMRNEPPAEATSRSAMR